jgi:beta-lactamase regulating signal transducer with metallopeptidase domain
MGIVLNWIAQGVVVAAATGAGLWLLPAGRARARMKVWWTVIAVVIALPLVTWWSAISTGEPAIPSTQLEPLVVVPQSVWNATSLAAVAWIGWVFLQSWRLGFDLRALARMRRECRPTGSSVEARLRPSTRARLTKSRARIMVSPDVRAAAVLGFGPPIIAVQPALIEQLTDAEFDQVLVHEWAHVARRDALGTLVQRLVHVLAGWHPAVWFAMGRLRMEREMACDEVVVDATGSAKAYAACLTRVASLGHASRGSHLAVAIFSSPALTRRVMRLLARRRTPAFAPYWMVTPAALAVVTAFAAGSFSLVGVQLSVLPLVELEVRAAELMLAPRIATADPPRNVVALARTRAAAPVVLRRQERVQVVPVSATVPTESPAAAPPFTNPTAAAIGTPEPPAAPSMPPAAVATPEASANLSPAPEAAAPLASGDVTTEAKNAWGAASEMGAQMGESIGRSSRKGAVSTAGFFTRLSKKVASSF